MKMETKLMAPVVLLALALVCPALHGQAIESDSDGWEFEVIPYLWGANIEADVKVEGVGTVKLIDMDFSDVLDKFQFGAFGAFEARNLPWILFADGQYTELRDDGTKNGVRIDAGVDSTVLGFGGGYRIGDSDLSFDLLGGGRYSHTKTKIGIGGGPTISRSDDYVEPFVGARLNADLSKKWFLVLRGDVGSFGVEADLTWAATAYLGYRLASNCTLGFGFRSYSTETEDGPITVKTKQYGPILGVGVLF